MRYIRALHDPVNHWGPQHDRLRCRLLTMPQSRLDLCQVALARTATGITDPSALDR